MSAEGRVEHQKLNQTTALLLFGWVFGVQLGSLEKSDSPKTLNRDEYDVICGWPLREVCKINFAHILSLWDNFKIAAPPPCLNLAKSTPMFSDIFFLFFSRYKSEKCPWKRFFCTLSFFHLFKPLFMCPFSLNFTGSPKFSRALFEMISRDEV